MQARAIDFDELEQEIKRVENRLYCGNDSKVIINAAKRLLELRKNTCVFGDRCSAKLKYQEMVNAKSKQ